MDISCDYKNVTINSIAHTNKPYYTPTHMCARSEFTQIAINPIWQKKFRFSSVRGSVFALFAIKIFCVSVPSLTNKQHKRNEYLYCQTRTDTY